MRTLQEFQRHIELHRARVVVLGLRLAKTQYPGIDLSCLEKFLRLHDYSKTILHHHELSKFRYKHRQLPVERLFEFYGLTPKSETETQKLMNTINDINAIDRKTAEDFFKDHSQLTWATQEDFYTIEKVADLVDRSLDPMAAEEFGYPMVLASEYIQDPFMAGHSLWLESRYLQITKNLSFPSVS